MTLQETAGITNDRGGSQALAVPFRNVVCTFYQSIQVSYQALGSHHADTAGGVELGAAARLGMSKNKEERN
jgi:hypothetical protein